jgi:Flp pilus assembly pilin Flp
MTQRLMRAFIALRYGEEGQTLFEYALILSLVSVTAIAVLNVIGGFPGFFLSQVTADL